MTMNCDSHSLALVGERGGQRLANLAMDYHVTPLKPLLHLQVNFPRNAVFKLTVILKGLKIKKRSDVDFILFRISSQTHCHSEFISESQIEHICLIFNLLY